MASPAKAQTGRYLYFLNGEPAPVEEHWERRPLAESAWQIKSARSFGDTLLQVDATETGRRIEQFQVCWQSGDELPIQASYQLNDDVLAISRTEGSGTGTDTQVAAPSGLTLLFPLMRIFVGPVIENFLSAGGEGTVVLPSIADPQDRASLLTMQESVRSARLLDAEDQLQRDGETITCRRCEYLGDQYTAGSEFWLAPDGLLQRYRWQQSENQLWDVWLQRH